MFEHIVLESTIICNILTKKNVSSFGYRERIQIERLIFLSLKLLLRESGYDLQGLSNKNLDKVRSYAEHNEWPRDLVSIINQAFEFKIYVKDISSSNAYVRNDALLRLSPDLVHLMPIISNKLMRLITKMAEFHLVDEVCP